MKKATALHDFILHGIETAKSGSSNTSAIHFENKDVYIDHIHAWNHSAELDDKESLSARFAVRDKVILNQSQKVKENNEDIELDSGLLTSLSTLSMKDQGDNISSRDHHAAMLLEMRSVFGSVENEPTLTNWNGEFKG
jgi:hypothetical protein